MYRGLGNGVRRALKEYPDILFENDIEGNQFKVVIKRSVLPEEKLKKLTDQKTGPKNSRINETGPKNSRVNENGPKTEPKNNDRLKKSEKILNDEIAILSIFSSNPKMTKRELAKSLGLTAQAVQRRLDKLIKDGRLLRKGSKKGGQWEVL